MAPSEHEPHPSSVDQVVTFMCDRLAAGPRRISDLVDDLLAAGTVPEDLLAALGREDDGDLESVREALTGLVDDALLDDARVWPTGHDDAWLVLVEQLADEMVLTHRLTEQERADGAVPVVPDLVTLDMDATDGLDAPGVGRLEVVRGPERSRPGHDGSVVKGPPGWLDAFSPGDLVMFERRGLTVEVTPVADPAPDGDVVAHLEDAARQRLHGERGEEAYPLVLDAMTTSPEAFRQPVRPLGELLKAAGLERRGFSWGPRDRPWLDAVDNARRMTHVLMARRYGFSRCCLAAYDRVVNAIDGDAATDTGPRLGRDLHHGPVAPAVVEHTHRFPDDTGAAEPSTRRLDRLSEIATRVAAGTPPHSAAGRLVLALLADARAEPELATSLAEAALVDDPDYPPAARQVILYHVDRGDLRGAVDLLARSGADLPGEGEAFLRRLAPQITSPYQGTGRNHPCPCGSGRKFKACCLGQPQRSPRLLGALLDLRLHLFVHDEPDDEALKATVAAMVRDPERDDLAGLASPVVADLVAFEGGLAQRYLDRRGVLLPADERAILEAAVDEPRRLWDVVDAGSALVLQDADTGRKARAEDPTASQAGSLGHGVLWRIPRLGEVDYPVGFPIEVAPDENAALRNLLAERPTALDLAGWYRALPG